MSLPLLCSSLRNLSRVGRAVRWLSLLGCGLGVAAAAAASTYTETFTYSDATALVGQGGWTQINATTNPFTVNNGALSFATSGQDAGVGLGFSTSSGSLYAGFDVKLSAAQSAGDYFFSFSTTASAGVYAGRFFAKSSGTGYVLGYQLGVTGATPTYSTTVLNYGTTYRIVIRYDFVTGSSNDTGTFYIAPTSSTETGNTAAISTIAWAGTTTESSPLAAVALRQGSAGSAPTITTFDNLIVSTAFADAANLTVVAPNPSVTSTSPANAATLVGLSNTVTVVFDQSVELADGWYTLVGSVSGAHSATVTGSGATRVLTPTTAFAESETVTLTVSAAQVTASTGGAAMAADYTASFTTALDPATIRAIHMLQGSGTTSDYTGQTISLQGIVTGFYLNSGGTRDGFYLQAPDAEADNDPATSEGIYVYLGDNTASLATLLASLATGDKVTVTGTVKEYSGLTELAAVSAMSVASSGNVLPAAVPLTLPLASSTYLERYEGMRVTLPQKLWVTNTYYLGQYGEISLSSGGVLPQPTNVVSPGAAAVALQAQNDLNQITVDDGSGKTYVDPTPYLYTTGSDPTTRTLRCGDTTTGVTGVLTTIANLYMVEPTATVVFDDANPRVAPVAAHGSVRVVGANVLNFFNGDGAGGGFPTSRGATTQAEYQQQRAHILAALLALDADIYGLTEVENDGFGSASAVQDLVNGLNAATSAGTYAFVNPHTTAGTIGTDVITCALIYRTTKVAPVGAAVVNEDGTFNRPPLAQTFRQLSNGEAFTVCINHFKSKGSAPSSGANVDQGDGQSAWNTLRTQQAQLLTTWLASDPTGSGDPDFLIIGDLNSYAKEDPIAAIKAAGYTNEIERFEGEGGYSYAYDAMFGHLDHALATASLSSQVVAAESWHNNSVEPDFIDYNVENKATTGANYSINSGDVPWRASDHDPVVVDLLLLTPQQAWRSAYFGTTADSGAAADAADPDGDGIVNLFEYALGTDPTAPGSARLPAGALENGNFVFRFTRPTATTDLTYTVQTSTDLLTWTTLGTTVEASTATTETLNASVAATGTKAFVRLTVGGRSTVPVGYLNVALSGAGATTTFGLPLEDPSGPASGLRATRVESLTSAAIANASGGWTSGALADAGAPWAVRFTSGAAAGRLVDIAGNTATAITLKNFNPVTAGVVAGDTFELVAIDTLETFFGATTLSGGTTAAAADQVKLYGSAWVGYYYSTSLGCWRLATGPTTNYNKVALRPSTGLQVIRRGGSLTLPLAGRVLGTRFVAPVANAGNTLLNLAYPMDTTLGALAVQARIGGWRSGTTSAADQVSLYNGTAWVGYVYNGAHWLAVNGGAISDAVSIPAGSAILLTRPGTTAGTTDFVQSLPY